MKKNYVYLVLFMFVILVSACESKEKQADELRSQLEFSKAAKLYEQAMNEGSMYAKWRLGKLYVNGQGVPHDEKFGIELIEQAAENGCEEAKVDLAKAYLFGMYGLTKDEEKVSLICSGLLAESKNDYCLAEMAMALNSGLSFNGYDESPLSVLERVKNTNNPQYLRAMSGFYFFGADGIEKNMEKALEYGERAFNAGAINVDVAYIISYVYRWGLNNSKADVDKAIEWLEKGIKSVFTFNSD